MMKFINTNFFDGKGYIFAQLPSLVQHSLQAITVLFICIFGVVACGGGSDSPSQPAARTFTLSYDGNADESGATPVDTTNYNEGDVITVVGNPGGLVRAGYSFIGWNTAADGSGTNYSQGQAFTMGAGDVVLFANWSSNPTYTVSYDGNGNDAGDVPIDSTSYESNQTVVVASNSGSLQRSGYSFIGWNTSSDGSGAGFAPNASVVMEVANLVLYAQWSANPTYSVTYDGNGNDSGSVPEDINSYEESQSVTVLGNLGNLSKSGFTFIGWNTAADSSGTSYGQGQTFTMGSSEVVLYARWSANPTFSVTYDGNGNDAGTTPVDSTRYEEGQMVTVVGNTGGLSRAGYSFTGWNTKADGSGTTYAQLQNFVIAAADVTLYARWSANPTYTLSYDGNAYDGGSVPLDSTRYETGQSVVVAGNSGGLMRAGYSFVGWNTAADGSGNGYTVGQSMLMGAADVVLYAQWSANPTYAVTYDGNGANGGSVPVDSGNYEAGYSVSVLGNPGNLVRSGHSFVGWNNVADGSGTLYTQGQTFSMGTGNVVLYAQWSPNPTFSVTYDGNGSDSGNVPVDSSRYEEGQTVQIAGNSGNLNKNGFSFVGWGSDPAGGGTGYAPGGSFTMGTSNVTLYAQWTAEPTYTVTYQNSNADGGTVPTDPVAYRKNQFVTVLGNSGNLTRQGYKFVGWYHNVGGGGSVYSEGQVLAMGSANVVFSPRWSDTSTGTVTYNISGADVGTVPAPPVEFEQGQLVTILGNTGGLSRAGYTFTGWKDGGSNTNYKPGDTFYMGSSFVTLYAQWAYSAGTPTYTISYDGNNHSGGSVPTDTIHYVSGETAKVVGNIGNLTRSGYNFIGWNSAADGSGTDYPANAPLTMGASDVTLYAQWTTNPVYRVVYRGRANTSGSAPVDYLEYEAGQTVTVLENTGKLYLGGYNYLGWNTAMMYDGIDYAPGDQFTMGTADVVLYAKWQAKLPTLMYSAGQRNGNMGGRSGANAICAAAKPVECGIRNKVHAFFSSNSQTATVRTVTLSDIPRVTGIDPAAPIAGPCRTIANNWNQLTTANLNSSMAGACVVPNTALSHWWSGTAGNGSFHTIWDCMGGTSNSWTYSGTNWMYPGLTGSTYGVAPPTWYDDHTTNSSGNAVVPACNEQHHLICVCGE